MKKILVVSDTHMDNDTFSLITARHRDCDYFVHCGDSSLPYNDPLLNGYITVIGNHDDDPHYDQNRFFKVEDQRIFVTHGHLYDVYLSYDKLYHKAKQMNCSLVLHGHTHIPHLQTINGITFINPGSVMFNRSHYGYGTYALVFIDHTQVSVHFYHHETHQIVDDIVLQDGEEILKEFGFRHDLTF